MFYDCHIQLLPNGGLKVELDIPARALTTGQYAVFFEGEELIGSAALTEIGPSCYEQGHTKLPDGVEEDIMAHAGL